MLSALFVALFLLLIAPVKLGAAAGVGREGIRIRLGLMVWGLRWQGAIRLQQGRAVLLIRGRQVPLPPRKQGSPPAASTLRHLFFPDPAQSRRRGVRITRAELHLDVGSRDAAAAALLTGLLRAAACLIPGVRITARPRMGGLWAARALCIAESRLGILCVAYALALKAGKKEEKSWSIPSAA